METPPPVCLVLTSWPAGSSVEPFARALIEARLAACVHVLEPGRSIYRWGGAVEVALERQVVIKTTRDRVAEVAARLAAAHPYDLPELLVCDAEGSRAYAAWVRDSVASGGE
ncbi:MAG: divalent-cation tolerance protein CutA [Acidobacteriota bacterium]